MMKKLVGILLASFLYATIASGAIAADESGLPPQRGDDNPRIDPDEIVAPPMNSTSRDFKPAYQVYEKPESINCDGRRTCESAKTNATKEQPK